MTDAMSPASLPTRRLTFLMDIIAAEAIRANDALFVQQLGLAIRELRVLRMIDDNPGIGFDAVCRISDLAPRLTARILRKLLEAGLVTRGDGFHTTPAGQDIREEGRDLSDSLEELLLGPFTAAERATFAAQLEMLARWVKSDTYRKTLEHHASTLPPRQPR